MRALILAVVFGAPLLACASRFRVEFPPTPPPDPLAEGPRSVVDDLRLPPPAPVLQQSPPPKRKGSVTGENKKKCTAPAPNIYIARQPILDRSSRIDVVPVQAHKAAIDASAFPLRLTLLRYQPTWWMGGDRARLKVFLNYRDKETGKQNEVLLSDPRAGSSRAHSIATAESNGWLAYAADTRNDLFMAHGLDWTTATNMLRNLPTSESGFLGQWMVYSVVYRVPPSDLHSAEDFRLRLVPLDMESQRVKGCPVPTILSQELKLKATLGPTFLPPTPAGRYLDVAHRVDGSRLLFRPVTPRRMFDGKWTTAEPIVDRLQATRAVWRRDSENSPVPPLKLVMRQFYPLTQHIADRIMLLLVDDSGVEFLVARMAGQTAKRVVYGERHVGDPNTEIHCADLYAARHSELVPASADQIEYADPAEHSHKLGAQFFVAAESTFMLEDREDQRLQEDPPFAYPSQAGTVLTFAVYVSVPPEQWHAFLDGRYRWKYIRFATRNGGDSWEKAASGYFNAVEVSLGSRDIPMRPVFTPSAGQLLPPQINDKSDANHNNNDNGRKEKQIVPPRGIDNIDVFTRNADPPTNPGDLVDFLTQRSERDVKLYFQENLGRPAS